MGWFGWFEIVMWPTIIGLGVAVSCRIWSLVREVKTTGNGGTTSD